MYKKSGSLEEDIENVELIRSKSWLNRWDTGPFLIAYCILGILSFSESASVPLVFFTIFLTGHVIIYMLIQSLATYKVMVAFTKTATIANANFVFVVPNSSFGSPVIVPLYRKDSTSIKLLDGTKFVTSDFVFEYHKSLYEYNLGEGLFIRQKPFIQSSIQKLHLDTYSGHTSSSASAAYRIWGTNDLDVPIPSFLDLYVEHLISPFFVFQSICLVLWSLDDYWYYSLFTFLMLLVFEGMMCRQRQNSLMNLKSMRRISSELFVYRDKKWTKAYADEIVPGDLIALSQSTEKASNKQVFIPCDMLLLSGSCITNEAMLTGESTPQLKECFTVASSGENSIDLFDLSKVTDKTKRQLLYGGTNLISASNSGNCIINTQDCIGFPKILLKPDCKLIPSEDMSSYLTGLNDDSSEMYLIGLSLQTGFNTMQGKLMRKILFAKESMSSSNIETFAFIGILVVFALSAATYVLLDGISDADKNKFRLALHCIMIITSVIPPELPMELSLAITTSLAALSRSLIYCTEPFRIPFAGKVDVLCFDKTGTLTQDKLNFHGFVSPSTQTVFDFSATQSYTFTSESLNPVSPSECSDLTLSVLGTCHSVFMTGLELTGDFLEIETLKASTFRFSKLNNFDNLTSDDLKLNASIRKRFHFSSELKRMSVIVKLQRLGESISRDFAFVKGAPEIMACIIDDVPDFYESVYNQYASRGYRILAIAGKKIIDATAILSREEAESNLKFLGFLIFSSDLKVDSRSVVRELNEAKYKIVMITGDGLLTSLDVARRVAMVGKKTSVVTLTNVEDGGRSELVWRVADVNFTNIQRQKGDIKFEIGKQHMEYMASNHCLCITGQILQQFQGNDFDTLCGVCVVFARMSPIQKTSVITSLRKQNFYVLMCGDGTNDVGALRSAHVGISVVNDSALESKLSSIKSGDKSKRNKVTGESRTDRLLRAMAEAQLQDEDPTIIQLGDASLASAFTARRTSIDAVLTVIRQGRCTLVTTIQVYKILALNCLVSAYVMSWMHIKGLRQGDMQMTAIGIMNAGLFFFLSQTKPIDHLSEKKPVASIFSLPVVISVTGQFLVHLILLIVAVVYCSGANDENATLIPDGSFQPNIVNTSVFLLSAIININNFVVNYRGYPFTQSLSENSTLFRVVCGLYLCVVVVLGGQFVFVNDFLQMKAFPSPIYQVTLAFILLTDFGLAYFVEVISRRFE